jgi:tetratricopeptide (TPR) repeat protein
MKRLLAIDGGGIRGVLTATPTSEYDIFISYAHQGDHSSREAVSALVARLHSELEADFHQRFGRKLEIFFDKEDLQDFDHWQVRCHRALRSSRFFIACLSRSYLRSDACRWEWEEWCKYEVERGMSGQSAASLWFVKVEDLDSPDDAARLREWQGDLRQRFHIQCHEWRHDDPATFLDTSARAELQQLTEHVAQRLRLLALDRARRGNLPWPNSNFVGREPELARLRASLLDAPEPTPVGLHGVGGMGKTALAHAFAYHEADAFPGGCWLLRCEGRDRLLTVLRGLVADLEIELTDDEKLDDAKAVRRVFDKLRPRGPALFLLDNVDRPALLTREQMEILAGEPWVRPLYTTRLAASEFTEAGAEIRPLDLDRLPEDQAVALIRRYQPEQAFASPDHEVAAREIVRELNGLTLAVETAAVYLGQCDSRVIPEGQKEHSVEVTGYLSRLRDDLRSGGGEGVMSQLREVTATLRPTLDRLDAPARTLLQCAALLGPDAIALPWLRTLAGTRHPELATDAPAGHSDPWTQLIRNLLGMRLFQSTPEPRVVTVHRILHRVLETNLREDRAGFEASLLALVRERDAALKNSTCWESAHWEIEPFAALAWLWAEPARTTPSALAECAPPIHPQAAWLLNQAGERRRELAEWSRAEPLLRRAITVAEGSCGHNHPNVAIRLINLALLLLETNRLRDAEPLMRRALAIDETHYGPEHPEVATDLSSLAQLLQSSDRLGEAEPLIRRALAIDEAHFGLAHTNVAIRLSNLAQLLKATNRLDEAEPLMRRALDISTANLEKDNPNVATRLNNLGALLRDTNRLDEAEPLMRRALDIDEAYFGIKHPIIARDLGNLGALLQATNRLDEAEPLMRRALDIDEAYFETNPTRVSTDLCNLAVLLQACNRLDEAENLMRRALAIDKHNYGATHPEVATDLYNLAQLLVARNRLAEAEPLMRQMVEIVMNITYTQGTPHPHLQIFVNNYSELLQTMGRSEQAIKATITELGRRYGICLRGE